MAWTSDFLAMWFRSIILHYMQCAVGFWSPLPLFHFFSLAGTWKSKVRALLLQKLRIHKFEIMTPKQSCYIHEALKSNAPSSSWSKKV